MKGACLTPDALADLVRGDATAEDERHLNGCESCRRRVTLVRRIAAAGLAPIAGITAEVDDLVARLLAAPRATWWRVVREVDFQREDVARRLLTLALDARFRDRQLSVALAQAATMIVDAIESSEIAELRFETWKFLSAILREAGRYAELPRAFMQAAEAAAATREPEVAHASMLLSRALYYSEPDIWKPKKAAALLNRAERVFASRDASRLHAVRIARAFLLFRRGDMLAAREAFAEVLAATPQQDRVAYLYALNNLIAVRVELHEAEATSNGQSCSSSRRTRAQGERCLLLMRIG